MRRRGSRGRVHRVMEKPLNALLVEDSETDAELLLLEIARGGYEVVHERVETEADMRRALAEGTWDIVLSDYSLPQFNALAAIEVLRQSGLDIPIIIVSGTIGEDIAVPALKAGAYDFMPKDRLSRLLPAIQRELRECQVRRRERESEQTRRAAEARFRVIMETATDGVVAIDQRGFIEYVNPAAAKMFGYTSQELAGKALQLLIPERFRETPAGDFSQFLESSMLGRTVEVAGRRRDGSEFPIDLSLASWSSDGQVHFAGIMRDVTERKNVDAQLAVADRMIAVGTLSAGVGHEINNPLAAIIGNLDLALRDLDDLLENRTENTEDLGRVREELVDARDAADRVRRIVRDLRVFSRGEDEQPGPVDVERVLESTLRMAHNEIRHRAKLTKQYGGVPPVAASEARLGQVFLNLIMNAAQALREDGGDGNEIKITTHVESGNVVIEIADTGTGIAPDVMKRLFTPFVTTKPVGVGTGLGLSICHRIVTGFGGTIRVESELGKGTAFHIFLPLAEQPLPATNQLAPPSSTARRRGRVLVIDDEPLVARVVTRALKDAHEVIGLERATEAVDLLRSGQRFDVILCDLMMPQMSGVDFYHEIAQQAPDQARVVVFLTGGAFTPRARRFLDEVPNRRLEKPFGPEQLRSLVNSAVK
jgi:PAS domain S-box-containing protein